MRHDRSFYACIVCIHVVGSLYDDDQWEGVLILMGRYVRTYGIS